MPKIWAFDNIESKHTLDRGEDCMKNFCESFRENVENMIDFKNKKIAIVNKKRTKIISRCKKLLHCGKGVL